MKNLSRRDFLKLSAVAAAAGAVAPNLIAAAPASESKAPALEYRVLGRTGLKVTTVSLGCMVAPEEVIAKGFDAGINWFDTAHSYKGGRNEEEVGRVLKGKRDGVYICTKLPLSVRVENPEEGQPKSRKAGKADLLNRLDVSLKRLQTDHVDLVLGHGVSSRSQVMDSELREALEEAKKSGKTRFIGVSTHSKMDEVLNALVEAGSYDAVLTTYNFLIPQSVKDAAAKAKAAGIGIIAMKTQAAVVQTLNEAKKKNETAKLPFDLGGLTLHQAALRWVLDEGSVTFAVPGSNSFAQLDENLAVMGKRVGYMDRRRLEGLALAAGYAYCSGCGACAGTCPRGVAIPDVRRSAMYLYAYGDETLARESYAELHAPAAPCGDCAECSARCVRGIALQPTLAATHARLA